MPRHEPQDRVDVKLDVSQFFEARKTALIAIQLMTDEVDKAVILAGGKIPEKRFNGGDRRNNV